MPLRRGPMSKVDAAHDYFKSFIRKDLKSLYQCLTPEVVLKDWEGTVTGREALLAHNEQFFNSITDLKVLVNNVAENGRHVFAELEIIIDGESIRVVDVLEFDLDTYDIKLIKAYKM